MVDRGQKLTACYQYINTLLKDKKIDNTHYSFLLPLVTYIDKNKSSLDTDEKLYQFLHGQFGNSFKALFKIVK